MKTRGKQTKTEKETEAPNSADCRECVTYGTWRFHYCQREMFFKNVLNVF